MKPTLELDSRAGMHISATCEEAAVKAAKTGCPVHFEFNGTHVNAKPGETAEVLQKRWATDYEASAKAYREDPQRKVEQAELEEAHRQACAASMKEAAIAESELRDAKVPSPLTKEQLGEYIESLVNRSHDYGTCVYAMSMAATAAFNYVAGQLSVTGFQASCADLDILRRTRSLNGPFIILKGEDMLFPQYDLQERLAEVMVQWRPWVKEEAEKNLAKGESYVHPDVLAHWKKLATTITAP